jgi:hypothetical protein
MTQRKEIAMNTMKVAGFAVLLAMGTALASPAHADGLDFLGGIVRGVGEKISSLGGHKPTLDGPSELRLGNALQARGLDTYQIDTAMKMLGQSLVSDGPSTHVIEGVLIGSFTRPTQGDCRQTFVNFKRNGSTADRDMAAVGPWCWQQNSWVAGPGNIEGTMVVASVPQRRATQRQAAVVQTAPVSEQAMSAVVIERELFERRAAVVTLVVRSTPSSSGKPVQTLAAGAVVPVTGIVAGGGWLRVLANGSVAYAEAGGLPAIVAAPVQPSAQVVVARPIQAVPVPIPAPAVVAAVAIPPTISPPAVVQTPRPPVVAPVVVSSSPPVAPPIVAAVVPEAPAAPPAPKKLRSDL